MRDEQTLSFIPTNDDTSRDIYTEEVADGVSLLKIGCIYGSNASGKTNILKALDFFSRFMVDDSLNKGDEIGVVPFLLDNVSDKERTSFEMTFYLNREKYRLNLVLDNKVIYVPNSDLSASKIVNYTREKNRRVDLVFGAGYEFPVETVKAALSAAMARVPGVLETPAPAVHVDSFAASNIQYSVRAWCHHEDYWSVYYALMEAVPAAFADAGVSMSYEHMNVHVLDTPTSAKKD